MTKRRSQNWYGKLDKDGFIHRSWMKNQGFPDDSFDGRPIIGICNTWSELTPCNSGLRILAEAVKRGVWEAGGFPVEFPVMSLGETQMKPTAMLFRNLLAMDVEESIRAYGIDGVVLLGGCDKTTPGQLMGAASVDLPTIVVSSGPMLNGKWKGKDIGSGTDVWKFSEAVRAGDMSLDEFMAAESGMSRSAGVCMTMGTASTMASLVEAMGLSLPTNAALPAVDARRTMLAHLTGRRIVEMVEEDLRMSKVLTKENFENAIMANAAVGGSTNAVVHLLAIAGRAEIDVTLDDFELGSEIPLLVNCMPSGQYLMEDFAYAGGMPVILKELGDKLRKANTVMGKDISKYAEGAECYNRDVIYAFDEPLKPAAGLRVLRGNLAPKGAIVKPSAASAELLEHEAEAFVFENIEDLKANIDREDLPVTKDTILVLKGCGPKGYPGMPEVGNMPIPRKLVEQGVRDMVRVSDARMSGTAFGTVILHVSPEAEAGGNLALVKTGDRIRLSASQGALELLVDEAELEKRRADWAPTPPHYDRGYAKIYIDHVMGADKGADLDFLVGKDTRLVTREAINMNTEFHDIKGKHVFITGGGSGIGAALTEGYLRQGANVSFVQRSDASEFVAKMEAETGAKPYFIACDLSDIPALQKAMEQAEAQFGSIEILVNNAGNDFRHQLSDLTVEDWDKNHAVNLRPYYFTSQFVAPKMREKGVGHIVNYSSASYMMGNAGYPAYVAANAAITGLTRALARELGPDGIRVNALVPGWVLTQKQIDKWASPEDLKDHLGKQCLKEHLYAPDMVEPTLFLSSMASRMMTGQVIVVDGGVVVTG